MYVYTYYAFLCIGSVKNHSLRGISREHCCRRDTRIYNNNSNGNNNVISETLRYLGRIIIARVSPGRETLIRRAPLHPITPLYRHEWNPSRLGGFRCRCFAPIWLNRGRPAWVFNVTESRHRCFQIQYIITRNYNIYGPTRPLLVVGDRYKRKKNTLSKRDDL